MQLPAEVIFESIPIASLLEETETGYRFQYDPNYLALENPNPVSLTLPFSWNRLSLTYSFHFLMA